MIINYRKLERLLAAKKWKDADIETRNLMLKIAHKEQEAWLTTEDCQKFPLHELRTLDNLWIKYSNRHFGFSIQKQIWIDCGGTPGLRNDEVACKFGDQVGWLKDGIWIDYNSINWNIDNPRGHLPTPPPVVVLGILWNWLDGFYFLSSRI